MLPINDIHLCRIVFWGTAEFALPALETLLKEGRQIVGVVTNPDRRLGRKKITTAPPVKEWILNRESEIGNREAKIEILQPERLDESFKFKVSGLKPDLFIVAAYGKIIPKEILDIPRLGALNIHPSLLPRWRGPAPIQYAILNGDAETGVTIIKMDEEMDHGPIIASSKFKVQSLKFTYIGLHNALAGLGAELLIETLPKWLNGVITPVPQDDSKATYSKILTREDGRIDWSKSAEEIERMIRAFNPWPGAWTIWKSQVGDRRIRIEEADWTPDVPLDGAPGLVWKDESRPLLIKGMQDSLVVKKLGVEGKKVSDAAAFAHGYPDIKGAILI